MELYLELAFFIVSFLSRIECLSITKMTVPKFVPNGTEESVVLDCEYEYEKKKDQKLVVKWFHENDPKPVYQWIPEFDIIQSSERFGNRVNREYEIMSGDDYTKRRALNLLKPTTELSGTYICHVASFDGFDSKGEVMMVYAYPTNIHLNYSVVDDLVVIKCHVENVYPIPEMEMFQTNPGETDPTPIDDVELDPVLLDDAYDVVLTTNMTEDELETDTLRYFECVVSIDGASYRETKRIPYFPAPKKSPVRKGAKVDDASTIISPTLLLICLLTLSQLLSFSC